MFIAKAELQMFLFALFLCSRSETSFYSFSQLENMATSQRPIILLTINTVKIEDRFQSLNLLSATTQVILEDV